MTSATTPTTSRANHRLTLRPTYANIGMYQRTKNLTWLADSRSNVKSFPAGVQDDIGYALYAAQLGERSVKAKPWRLRRMQEEVQGRDRDAEAGDGTDPAAAQRVKK